MKEWIEASTKLFCWLHALLWSGVLAYMAITGLDIPGWFWWVYGPVLASVGIPIIYQGFKAVRGLK